MSQNDYLLGNLDAAGYFRVNYDSKNWENIIKQLNTDNKVF